MRAIGALLSERGVLIGYCEQIESTTSPAASSSGRSWSVPQAFNARHAETNDAYEKRVAGIK